MVKSDKNYSLKILHYHKLDSILMVEKAIQDSEDYPTRMELWKSLPKQMQYQTFKLILFCFLYNHTIVKMYYMICNSNNCNIMS